MFNLKINDEYINNFPEENLRMSNRVYNNTIIH